MITWVLYMLSASAILCIAALLAERGLVALALPTRFAWCAAAVGILALSAFTWRAPRTTTSFTPLTAPLVALTSTPGVNAEGVRASTTANRTSTVDVRSIGTGLWIFLSLAAALRLAIATISLHRRRRAWKDDRIDDTPVRITDGLGPAVVGFFAPVIALPSWVKHESPQRQRLIVAHEREHLRAGDQWVVALLLGVGIILPWNIVLWWLLRRAKCAIEIDCDTRVARQLGDVRAYAQLLIDVGSRVGPTYAFPGLAASRSALERRVIALTKTRPRFAGALAVGLTGAAALLTLLACEIPHPPGPGESRAAVVKAPTAKPTDGPAPFPEWATAAMDEHLRDVLPDVHAAGVPSGRAVWFVASRDNKMQTSWVGPAYSDAEFRRTALRPEFDTLLLSVWTGDRTAKNGASIPVVFAQNYLQWERGSFFDDRFLRMIRDSIRAVNPSLLSGLGAGQAIYFHADWNWKSGHVRKIWVGPQHSDARTRWEYARSQYTERVSLMATPMNVPLEDGRQIPIVELHVTPWARRYGD